MRSNLFVSGRLAALVAGAAFAGMLAASPASAAVEAGILSCNVAGGVGAIVASQKAVSCSFRPSDRAPVEFYTGSITRVGLDISNTTGGVLSYRVISTSTGLAPFSLAGNYFGPGVGVTLGSGVGVDALVGGNGNQLTLQPIVVSSSNGIGINAGVGTLNLSPAGTEAPRFRRHHRHYHHAHRG